MEDVLRMKSEVVDQKAAVEEIIREGDIAKTHVFKIAQDVIKNLRKIDQNVVSHLKAEALDEIRSLGKLEEKIIGAMEEIGRGNKIEEEQKVMELCEMMTDITKKLETVNNYQLSVLVKETNTGLYTDSICLTNSQMHTSDISMSLETTKEIIHIYVKPTSGVMSEHLFRSIIFSAKGMTSGYLILCPLVCYLFVKRQKM